MKPIITIIGARGKMGRAFTELFTARGHEVLEVDLNTKLRAEEAIPQADMVMFSVPISATPDLISSLAIMAKDGALLCDITSIKSPAVQAMTNHAPESCEVLGLHPMSGPGGIIDMKKTVVVNCPVRRGELTEWLLNFLKEEGAILKETSAEDHDKMMSVVQGITHLSSIATAMALRELDVTIEESLEYSSPVYRLRLDMVGRVLSQGSQLYSEIAVENPMSLESIKAYLKSVETLMKCVKKKDKEAFAKEFEQAADFLGDFKDEAYQRTSELIMKMK